MLLLGQAVAGGIGGGLGPVCHPGLGEDVADVAQHGVGADEQGLGDGPVAVAGGDQAQDLDLTAGQPRRPGRPRRRRQLLAQGLGPLPEPVDAELLGDGDDLAEQGGGLLAVAGAVPGQQRRACPSSGSGRSWGGLEAGGEGGCVLEAPHS